MLSLDKLGEQFSSVSTIEQHVPCLGDVFEFCVYDLLAVLGLDLARLDPAGQFGRGFLSILQVIDNDESCLSILIYLQYTEHIPWTCSRL